MHLLVTGGCGFIGSNLVHYLLRERPDWTVVNLDLLTYAGNLENLAGTEGNPRHIFVRGDICDRELMRELMGRYPIDAVIHLAAESHVDRSILGPEVFVQTNVLGTQVLLDAARAHDVGRFVMISTDEVYGSLGPTGTFTEDSPLRPTSPYSATKAGADLLAQAYHSTFGLDVVVTRCSNNYGPFQFPEKLIPLMIINARNDRELPVYNDGSNVRDWIHVEDHCAAILRVLERGESGEVYNVGANEEWRNIDVVKRLLSLTGKSEDLIRYVKDRPGHDFRYALDASKLRGLGWTPQRSVDRGLEETVNWYVENSDWCTRITDGSYREYYDTQYRERLAEEK